MTGMRAVYATSLANRGFTDPMGPFVKRSYALEATEVERVRCYIEIGVDAISALTYGPRTLPRRSRRRRGNRRRLPA